MGFNDNADGLTPRVVWSSIASMLAPTGGEIAGKKKGRIQCAPFLS